MTDKTKPHHIGHRARVKEKFVKSVEKNSASSLHDYELLEIILFAASPRGDVKPLAKDLIAQFGSLALVLSATITELQQIDNLSQGGVVAIKSTQEAAFRLVGSEIKERTAIQSWKALLSYCRATMSYNKTEQFRIFFLDKKQKIISDEQQQQGTVDHTPVYPREVVKRALELGASSIILAHNHPSGDPRPSKADVEMTKQIMQAAAPLGIMIHDHVIIGGKEHYSFAANGLI